MKIKISIKEDIRNVLKAGDVFDFDFGDGKYSEASYIFITGKNGCGKSTLMNCIRSYKCDNEGENKSSYGGSRSMKLGYVDIHEFGEKCEIESDFDKVFFLSSEFDDPLNFNNCGDAADFVEFGGFATMKKSNGERMLLMLSMWLKKNEGMFTKDSLIVFDEIDRGYDLAYQKGFMNMLDNLHKKYGVHFLCVVHNIFPLLTSKNKVFVMDSKMCVEGFMYVYILTDVLFEVTVNPDFEKVGELMKKLKDKGGNNDGGVG